MGIEAGRVFCEHLGLAYRVALAATGNPAEAEDAVQDSYLRFVESWASFDRTRPVEPYLARVVINAAAKLGRAEARRAARQQARSREDAMRTLEKPPVSAEELAALRTAVAELPAGERLAVSLHYLEGLTIDDTAAALAVPRTTAANRVQQGLDSLKRALTAAGFGALAAPVALAALPKPEAPAALKLAVAKLAAGGVPASSAAAVSAAAKGGLIVKIGLGVAAAGLVAGGVFWAVGGKSEEGAKPPAAERVPGKDYPYGEGVVYKREYAAIGSFRGGLQDGPGAEMEISGDTPRAMAPNGDWYFLGQEKDLAILRYDARKKRASLIAWSGPVGKRGGPAECARFAGGGYGAGMGLSVDPSGKFLVIQDTNNSSYMWKLDLETITVEPTSGAEAIKGSAVRGGAPDGSTYFAKADGKLKKVSPDGKTVQDLGVTLEAPLQMSSYFGGLLVNEKAGRLYAGSRDPYSPWGVFWYWDMKTGKATGLCGPKKVGGESGKVIAQDGGEVDKNFSCSSGPADKVSFWCCGGPSYGPDRGERYLYIPGGDESTCSRLDIEKKYVTKMVKADPKGDRSLWTFGDGKQGKDYKFADPYCWAGSPVWGKDGEYYMTWALCSAIDVYTPVQK